MERSPVHDKRAAPTLVLDLLRTVRHRAIAPRSD